MYDWRPPVAHLDGSIESLETWRPGAGRAEDVFRGAIAEDPTFAAAHNMLGWSIRNQGREAEEYLAHIGTALELSADATDIDRLFVEGSYFSLTEQFDEAVDRYESLLALDPNHFYAVNNLQTALQRLGRTEELGKFRVRLATVRPLDPRALVAAAMSLSQTHQVDQASDYIQRLRFLEGTPAYQALPANQRAWAEFFPAYALWVDGDLDGAVREIDALASAIGSRNLEPRPIVSEQELHAAMAGFFYAGLGQLDKARQTLDQTVDPRMRHTWHALLAATLGDRTATRRHLEMIPAGEGRVVSYVTVWAGLDLERAGGTADQGAEQGVRLGEMALSRGDTPGAVEHLERAAALGNYHAAERLVDVWRQRGDAAQARQALERAARTEPVYSAPLSNWRETHIWLRIRATLAREYRERGRATEAEALEGDMLRRLALADEGHPIVQYISESRRALPR